MKFYIFKYKKLFSTLSLFLLKNILILSLLTLFQNTVVQNKVQAALSLKDKSILFQSPSATYPKYKAFLKSNEEFISFINYYTHTNPPQIESDYVLNTFEEAKKAFLTDRPQRALSLLRLLTEKSNLQDWKELERHLFFESFLILADAAENSEMKVELIKKALSMGSFSPKSSLSKNTLEELRKLAHHKFWWTPPQDFQKFSHVLINGKKQRLKMRISLPMTSFRLTFLSNKFQPLVFKGNLSNLSEVQKLTNKIIGFSDNKKPISKDITQELLVYSPSKKIKISSFRADFQKVSIPEEFLGENKNISLDKYKKINSRGFTQEEKIFKMIFWGLIASSSFLLIKQYQKGSSSSNSSSHHLIGRRK